MKSTNYTVVSTDMELRPNVLIVDDRPENLTAVEAILQPLDVTLYTATSAGDALRYMLEKDFAVVLLDVEMPEVDGFETAKLIRSRPRSQNVPIIFLTAIGRDEASAQRGYELGAVDFLVKPVQPEILRWKVAVFAELARKASQERQLFQEQIARAESEALARRASLLANASAALASSLQADAMLESLAQTLVPAFAGFAAIFNAQRDQQLCMNGFVHQDHAAYTPTHPMHTHSSPRTDRGNVLNRVLDSRQSWVLDVTTAAESLGEVHADFMTALGMQCAMFLPIRGNGLSLGVLALYRNGRWPFNSDDRAFAQDVAERIELAVTNARLYEASQQAGRAKDQFLAVVSHELRTPLTAILGWVHILQSKQLSEEDQSKALRIIQRNAKLQSDLIADILDFSRFATSPLSVKFEDVEIRGVLEHCIETIRPVAEEKGVHLEYEASAGSKVVAGDPTRLQQVFSNLLSNAVKFTPHGGRVRIKFDSTESHAAICVTDTGVGIPQDFIPHVFDPFIQADNSSTRSHSGLGLGLAIVRHLVEIHGGSISVASPGRGQGSTFTVLLPLRSYKALAS